jgi:chorismate mutase
MTDDPKTLDEALLHPVWQTLFNSRSCISTIDAEIVRLLAMRQEHARSIGCAKRKIGLAVYDHARETEVVNKFRAMAKERGLPLGHAETVLRDKARQGHKVQAKTRKRWVIAFCHFLNEGAVRCLTTQLTPWAFTTARLKSCA